MTITVTIRGPGDSFAEYELPETLDALEQLRDAAAAVDDRATGIEGLIGDIAERLERATDRGESPRAPDPNWGEYRG